MQAKTAEKGAQPNEQQEQLDQLQLINRKRCGERQGALAKSATVDLKCGKQIGFKTLKTG